MNLKPDQTPGANQDAGGIPVYPEAAAAPPECRDCGEPLVHYHGITGDPDRPWLEAAPPEPPRPDLGFEWPKFEPGEECPDCGAVMHGHPCIHHEDHCPVVNDRAVAAPEGLSLDVDALTQMLRRIDGNHNEFVARVHAERLLPLLAEYARLSPSSGESGSPPEPFDSQARDLLEACHERNIHSRGDMEYQFQPWAIDGHRLRVALERSRISHDAEPTDGLCARCGDDAETLAAEYNRVGSGSPGEPE